MKPRETRRPVMITARMRTAVHWADVSILNISSRGLMLHSPDAPPLGSYLEVRRGRHAIVARVVWSKDKRFGVRTQDPLSIESILREPDNSAPEARPAVGGSPVERRASERRRTSDRHARSRLLGRAFEFAGVGLAGALAALACYGLLVESFARPLAQVTAALAPK